MNTGQMMLVIGAFAMLSILALAFNRTMFTSLSLGLEMEATLNALSIGQSMLDEVLAKDFDETVTGGRRAYSYSDVTLAANFGEDSGETITGLDSAYYSGSTFYDYRSKLNFDDIDDYHLYQRRAWDPRMGYFDVIDSVTYVSETAPSAASSTRTFFKQITVVVTHPNLPKASDTSETSLPIILRDLSIYRRFF